MDIFTGELGGAERMILYNIQHFGDVSWIPWLIGMLQHSENQFLVTYDGSEEDVLNLQLMLNGLNIDVKRVAVCQSLRIHWCGPSQVKMLIKILGESLEIKEWDYFVNLSGSCIPLQTQNLIRSRVDFLYKSGKRASFFSFPVKKKPEMPTAGYYGHIKDIRNPKRLVLRGEDVLINQFYTESYFPIRNPQNRVFLGCSEPEITNKILEIYRPTDDDLEFRKSFFKTHQLYCGTAWYIFHRSVCEKLHKYLISTESEDVRHIFLTCFEGDESFLPTIIRGMGLLKEEEILNDSLRAFQGAARQLNDTNFELLIGQSHQLFARKVDFKNSPGIISFVENIVTGNG